MKRAVSSTQLVERQARPDARRLSHPAMWVGFAGTVLLGAILRFAWLGHLNFRNDESFTLLDARQSWGAVLGLDGFYDYHPPLSFALAKFANLFLPEVLSSRAVAALCGVLAIPVFFLLVSTLADTRAALAGSALLAVSPAHVEYSRIGRMYAPVSLAVLVSYLAMALFWRDGRRRWALPYGLAVASAVYLDYSALYALIPQLVPLAIITWSMRERATWLLAGGVGALIVYAPWLTQIRLTIELANDYPQRQSYLEASRETVWKSVPWVLGLLGGGAGRRADWPNVWFRFPNWRDAMLIALVPLAIAGLFALRRSPLGLSTAVCLLVGTPLACVLVSQISPGYALRTILPAPLGWCMLAGCAVARVRMPVPMRFVAIGSGVFLLVASVNALPATFSNKGRVLRVDNASLAVGDVAPMGKPVITFSAGGMDTDLIEAFAGDAVSGLPIYTFYDGSVERRLGMMPWAERSPNRLDVRDGKLATYFDPSDPVNDAFWFFTHRNASSFHKAFAELGYERRLRLDFSRVLLELWALPDANLGEPVDIGGAFSEAEQNATGWEMPPAVKIREQAGQSALVFPETPAELAVTRTLPVSGPGLYSLNFAVEDESGTSATVAVFCQSADGTTLVGNALPEKDDDADDQEKGTDVMQRERMLRLSVLCPDGTDSLRIELSSTGESLVAYRTAELVAYRLPSVSPTF